MNSVGEMIHHFNIHLHKDICVMCQPLIIKLKSAHWFLAKRVFYGNVRRYL